MNFTRRLGAGLLVALLLVPATAQANDARIRALEKQLEALKTELDEVKEETAKEAKAAEKKTNVLAGVVDDLRDALVVPEDKELVSQYGFGPAASKIYSVGQGLSIGGYGEALFTKPVSDKGGRRNIADYQRLILYFGYKFNDWVLLNTEIEFEHASTSSTLSSSGGSASVEFAYLDFFLHDKVNARVGMLLAPIGIVNELHEPVTFYGVNRPEVERRMIPTTWRENGFGLFGNLTPQLSYRMYALNGLNARGFDRRGLRGGRQKGNRAFSNDFGFAGRVDYVPTPGLTLAGSYYIGNSGQGQEVDGVRIPNSLTQIIEGHAIYRWRGLEVRGLFTAVLLDDARDLTLALRQTGDIGESEVIAKRMLGGYVEAAYDVMPFIRSDIAQTLSPFVRFSYLNTQDDVPSGFVADNNQQDRIWTFGIDYKPIPQVALKLDYRDFNPVAGTKTSSLNVGVGFVF